MEKLTPEQVRHVALLARLELTPEDVEHFAGDLNSILGYVDKLNELDTQGVPPTSHSFHLENVFREDRPWTSLRNEEALANAPEQEEGCFKVPAVIQESGGA